MPLKQVGKKICMLGYTSVGKSSLTERFKTGDG